MAVLPPNFSKKFFIFFSLNFARTLKTRTTTAFSALEKIFNFSEVLFNRDYFTVKEWGDWSEFGLLDKLPTFDDYKKIAEEQQKAVCQWAIHGSYRS